MRKTEQKQKNVYINNSNYQLAFSMILHPPHPSSMFLSVHHEVRFKSNTTDFFSPTRGNTDGPVWCEDVQ